MLGSCGEGTVIEPGVRVFHPENLHIGSCVYIGHNTIINAYHSGHVVLEDGVWIGAGCFLHGAGGLRVGAHSACGPHVKIITSVHRDDTWDVPVLWQEIVFAPVTIEPDSSVGMGSCVLPGVTIGPGSVVGAGSVVTTDIPPNAVAAGTPARVLRSRRD
ncbi:MAG: transferase [Armatimonadetes bacterium]|nr:transferase [Armatimonadota bacterium]